MSTLLRRREMMANTDVKIWEEIGYTRVDGRKYNATSDGWAGNANYGSTAFVPIEYTDYKIMISTEVYNNNFCIYQVHNENGWVKSSYFDWLPNEEYNGTVYKVAVPDFPTEGTKFCFCWYPKSVTPPVILGR